MCERRKMLHSHASRNITEHPQHKAAGALCKICSQLQELAYQNKNCSFSWYQISNIIASVCQQRCTEVSLNFLSGYLLCFLLLHIALMNEWMNNIASTAQPQNTDEAALHHKKNFQVYSSFPDQWNTRQINMNQYVMLITERQKSLSWLIFWSFHDNFRFH